MRITLLETLSTAILFCVFAFGFHLLVNAGTLTSDQTTQLLGTFIDQTVAFRFFAFIIGINIIGATLSSGRQTPSEHVAAEKSERTKHDLGAQSASFGGSGLTKYFRASVPILILPSDND